eukprot:984934-Prymnesium_polylepis.1
MRPRLLGEGEPSRGAVLVQHEPCAPRESLGLPGRLVPVASGLAAADARAAREKLAELYAHQMRTTLVSLQRGGPGRERLGGQPARDGRGHFLHGGFKRHRARGACESGPPRVYQGVRPWPRAACCTGLHATGWPVPAR